MRGSGSFMTILLFVIAALSAVGIYAQATETVSPLRTAACALLSPVQAAMTEAGEYAAGMAESFTAYRELSEENEALRAVAAMYEAQANEAEAVFEENNMLRELLRMRRRYKSLELLPARVIAVSGTRLTLDCGTADGAEVGNAVLSWSGMAGAVTAVGEHWCELALITDDRFSAGAIISRTGETGVLEGDGSAAALSYLPAGCAARSGDRAVTSGLGGLYPPGLPLGRVATLETARDGLSASAAINPDCEEIPKRVFVVTDFTVSE